MKPKPAHLGREFASQFEDSSVVAAYHFRPPYPAAVFDILVGLVDIGVNAVLDVGCGTGELARPLAERVTRVDAVDASNGMIAKGRALPGGQASNLTWIHGRLEDASLRPPYGLVVAGASLHWMEWDVALPRIRDALSANGVLAIVGESIPPAPWTARMQSLIDYSSTNREYRPYDQIDELEQRDLFRTLGRIKTEPITFSQSIGDYVESFHARNGLSRDRMDPAVARSFDSELSAIVREHAPDGIVRLEVSEEIVWGLPAPPTSG